MEISGKKIWLIGASEGIGAALAKKLSENGAKLALSARNAEKLESIKSAGDITAPLDVTNLESIKLAHQKIIAAWGQIDVLIFCSGTYEPMSASEMDIEKSLKTLDVNLSGMLRAVSVVLPEMLAQKTGHIVLFGSVAGYRGLPRSMAYGISKAGNIHLAECLKIDLEPANIGVQIVCPGFVKTRLTDKNNFKMPFLITSEKAAEYVVRGIKKGGFEIHFPKRFTLIMKALTLLPHSLYFRLARKL